MSASPKTVPVSSPPVDQVGVVERPIVSPSAASKQDAKMQGLKMVLSMIDLTTLEGMDTPGKVKQLCYKAAIFMMRSMACRRSRRSACIRILLGLPNKRWEPPGIKVASVATAFPSGNSSLAIKLDDVRMAVEQGADEIDMVISRGKFHAVIINMFTMKSSP